MKPEKLGTAETILEVGCEGGGLTLLRAEVFAWEGASTFPDNRDGRPVAEPPREVFWMERNEVLLCDLLDEDDQVCSPTSQSEFRTTLPEAVSDFMNEYSWWKLYPTEINSGWREAITGLLEQRLPGWRGAPSFWLDECPHIERWIELLRPAPPRLTMTYLCWRNDDRPQGIRIEVTGTSNPDGFCWEIPFGLGAEDWSKWTPTVPGIPLPEGDAAEMLACVQQAIFSLPLPSEEKSGGVKHRLTMAVGHSQLQVTWGDYLPIELAGLKGLVTEFLDSWLPAPIS